MDSPLRLDLVHTSPVISTALRHALRSMPDGMHVTTTAHSWTDFQIEWDFAGEIVVLDALLDDHVPLPLKVRALRRLGSRVVILGPGQGTPFAARTIAEGAAGWISPEIGVVATAEAIRDMARGRSPRSARVAAGPAPVATLTDRQLQVLALYVSTRGHSPADIGRVLSLRTSTIRSHLERGRSLYRARGVATHHRLALRAALVDDGWVLDPNTWSAAARI